MTSENRGPGPIAAALEISGFACPPERITAALGVQPTQTWNEGDPLPRSTARRRKSGWRLTAPAQGSEDLEVYASWLLDQLPERIDLSAVTGSYGITLWFTVHVGDQTPSAYLSADTIRRLAALGAGVDIDMYGGFDSE